MKVFSKLTVAAVGMILGMAASPAQAAILGASEGGTIIDAPNNTAVGRAESTLMQGFDEKQNFLLQEDLQVDFGQIIEAGTLVNSQMIFLDTPGNSRVRQSVEWLFDGEILGVISDPNGNLEAASNFLGAEKTQYNNSQIRARGLESGETYTVDGNKLSLTMTVTSPGDWIRVVTKAEPQAVPEPASVLSLLAVGAFGTASTLKRKKNKAA